ncbi:hypothetical protein A8H37_11265 [Burkholderia thailandensis]|nr:hypothetical protein A8H37_11265 [Burkholderia thailandensis]
MKRACNLSVGFPEAYERFRCADSGRVEVVCTTLRRPILPGNQCFSLGPVHILTSGPKAQASTAKAR